MRPLIERPDRPVGGLALLSANKDSRHFCKTPTAFLCVWCCDILRCKASSGADDQTNLDSLMFSSLLQSDCRSPRYRKGVWPFVTRKTFGAGERT